MHAHCQVGDYQCQCTEGWEGRNCGQDSDSCAVEERCQNGGVCVDLVSPVTLSGGPDKDHLLSRQGPPAISANAWPASRGTNARFLNNHSYK